MTHYQRLDYFAGLALQALIAKMPLLDQTGAIGQPITNDELVEIKINLCESAYEYAQRMLVASQKPIEWVKENEPFLTAH